MATSLLRLIQLIWLLNEPIPKLFLQFADELTADLFGHLYQTLPMAKFLRSNVRRSNHQRSNLPK